MSMSHMHICNLSKLGGVDELGFLIIDSKSLWSLLMKMVAYKWIG